MSDDANYDDDYDNASTTLNERRNHNKRNTPSDDESRPENESNRQRVETMIPYETHLIGTPVMDELSNIKLSKLTDPEQMRVTDLDSNYIDLQLLRIISPGPNTNLAHNYSRTRNKMTAINYYRMFLLRVSSLTREKDNCQLCYIMETKSTNTCLFDKNVNFRDNGTITIGTFVRMLRPQPVTNFINDIPLLETFEPLIALKRPTSFYTIPIKNQISGNEALSFMHTAVKVTVLSMPVVESTCSGLFCDKQRVHDWANRGKGCGCYSMLTRRSSLVIDHRLLLSFSHSDKEDMIIDHFSSIKFSTLYMTSYLPPSTKISALSVSSSDTKFFILKRNLNKSIRYINNNGGFTLVGWYKKGVINDKTLLQSKTNTNNATEVNTVDGEINHHVVELLPTNTNFFNKSSVQYQTLQEKKFNTDEYF